MQLLLSITIAKTYNIELGYGELGVLSEPRMRDRVLPRKKGKLDRML